MMRAPKTQPDGTYSPDDLLNFFEANAGASDKMLANALNVSVDRIHYFRGNGMRKLEVKRAVTREYMKERIEALQNQNDHNQK